ncbi:MAG: SusC/RagA family TonB-linked outer membrane protein [Bacteroidales bacterium]|nr:SusC/RagA family TonB-linked outer membrane protein [Bacteroidales bacterium]
MKKTLIRVISVAAMLMLSLTAFAQKHQVSGKVIDASTGEPVIGAGVVISSGGGVVTDYDGNYILQASDDDVLTFTSIGFESVSEKVDGRRVIDVNLQPDSKMLEEVVVLGFTTQKKAELTSSVVSVSGEKLTDITTPDVGNMLQGKVAGVMVMNSSGQPGSGADIRIRGTGSISAGAGPLYVVDGVAGGSFNPNDIETLTVLKDASATALYGAAAAGGVIVITTKGAKTDKATVDFKASVGIKRALRGRFKAMDSYEYYDFLSMVYGNKVNKHAPTEDRLENMNFNWVDNCFKTGVVQNYYASVSGKSGKVSYYASLDHYDEQGSLLGTAYKRNAARINLSAPITDRLTMNVRVNYQNDHADGELWSTREACYVMIPFDVPYRKTADGYDYNDPLYISSKSRPDGGTWYSEVNYNVFHNQKYNFNKSHSQNLVGDLQLIWNVTDWLTITSTNRYDSSNSFSEVYYDPRTADGSPNGELTNSEGEWNGWGTTNLAKFHKTFGAAHDVNAVVGWEYGEGYSRQSCIIGSGMPAGQRSMSNCPTVMTDPNSHSYDYNSRTWALLSQAQYSYQGKYIVTASLRYDESYKFGPDARGGFFPGVSGAWVMSSENFMKNYPQITFLKLRAGYGKTGNDNIPAFKYQDLFSLSAQYNGSAAAFVQQQANWSLGWEEAYMASLGVDATIKNNVNITLDFYNTLNDKLLLERQTPPSSGFFARMENIGKVRNMGVEFAVDGTIMKMGDLVWYGGLNLGANQNRVVLLPEHEPIEDQKQKVSQLITEGRDIYSWYMPKWYGVDENTGRPLWEKIVTDDDGKETIEYTDIYGDATKQIVGSASPWFSGGLNTSLAWKNFTLSATGSFVVGNKIFNLTRQTILDTDGAKPGYNQQSFDNGLGWIRWQKGDPDGTNWKATHPRALDGGNSQANEVSSRYLEDGSFFRVRNITLSYDLPQRSLARTKLSSARVYLSADNILTLTRFSGMDPEVSLTPSTWSHVGMYSDNYPVPLSIVMGFDVKF